MDSDRLPDWTPSLTGCRDARFPVRLGIVDGREAGDGRTVLAAQGFGARIEPCEMRRFALIAQRLRARIVVIETPGFGVDGSGLLPAERKGLRAGDFGPLAARLLEAALQMIDAVDDGMLSFLGYSLGASLAGAMAAAAAARGWAVDELILVEPVALTRRTLSSLLAAVMRERRWDPGYLEMNDNYPPTGLAGYRGNKRSRWGDPMRLGAALRTGGLLGQVRAISPPPRRVVVVRADDSALTAAVGISAASLRASGMPLSELVVGGHHGFWHSLPLVAAMADELRGVSAAGGRGFLPLTGG